MGDNQLSILIQAKINEASKQTMQDQLNELAKGLKSVKISLDLGDVKAQFAKMFQEIEKESQKQKTKVSGLTQVNPTNFNATSIDAALGKAQSLDAEMQSVLEKAKQLGEIKSITETFSSADGSLKKLNVQVVELENGLQKIKTITVMQKLSEDGKSAVYELGEIKVKTKEVDAMLASAGKDNGLYDTMQKYNSEVIDAIQYAKELESIMYRYGKEENGLTKSFESLDINTQKAWIKEYENAKVESLKKIEEQVQAQAQAQVQAEQSSAQAAEKTNKELIDRDTLYRKITTQMQALQNYGANNKNVNIGNLTSIINQYGQLRDKIQNGNITLQQARAQYANLGAQMRQLKQETQSLTTTSSKLFNTFKMFVGVYSLYDIFNLGKKAIKDMVNEVKTLDSALVELNKVSNLSEQELNAYVDTAFKVSETVGRLGSDVVNATSDFVQMGYSVSEAAKLAENALMYVNVGDLSSVDDAASTMISTMKAFGIEAENSLEIVDKINNMSNNFAISAEGIGAGLQRASSALAAANNDIDETLALMSVGNQVVQDPESLSTGLKIISMRIRGLSEDGELLESNMEEVFATYANGVKVLNDDGSFRSTFDILNDLGKEWDKLSDKTQAYLAETVAGKHRANIFLSLMQNAEDLEKALETSQNSANSAMRENESFMNSIEGKTQQLKSAWQQLSTSFVSSDLVKGIIDATTAIVKFLGDGEKLKVLLAALTTAFTALTMVKMHSWLSGLTIIPKVAGWFSTLGAVMIQAKAGTIGLAGAMSLLNITPVGLAITALTAVVAGFAMASSKAKQKAEELAEANRQLAEAGQESVDSITAITDSYTDLYDPVTQTITDKERLVEIQEELIKTFGSEADGIDLVNGKYDETLAKLNELTEAKLKQNEVFLRDAYLDAQEEAENAVNGGQVSFLANYNNTKGELKKVIQEMQKEFGDIFKVNTIDGKDFFRLDTTDIKKAEEAWTAMVEKMLDADIDRTNSTYQQIMKTLQGASTASENYTKAQDDLNNNLAQSAVKSAMAEAGCVDLKNATEEQVKSISNFMKELKTTDPVLASYTQKLLEASNPDFSNFTKANAEALNTYNTAISTTEQAMASAKQDVETLDSAITTLTNNQMLSGDTINELISKYSELQNSLTKTDKGYTLSKEALIALRNSKVDEANTTAQTQRNNVANVIKGVKSRLTAYKQEVSAIKTLAQAQQALAGAKAKSTALANEEKELVDNRFNNLTSGKGWLNSSTDILKLNAIQAKKEENEKAIVEYESLVEGYKTLEELDKIIQGMDVTATNSFINATTPSSSSKKKNSSSSDKKSYIAQELDVLIDDILSSTEKLEYAIEFANEKLTTAQNKGDLETQNAIKNQIIDLIKQRKAETVKQADQLRVEGEKMISVLSGTGLFKGVDLKNLTEKQLTDVTKILEKKIATSTDSQAEDLELLKAKVEEYGQAIIRIYGEELPTLSKAWWEIHNEYMEKMQEAIEDTYNLAKKKIDASNRDIEIQQILLKEGSKEYIELEKKKYQNLLALQEETNQALKKIKEQDKNLESEMAQEYLEIWYDTEKEKREMIKSINEQIMELRKEELEKQIDTMEEYQDAMEDVIDATVKMIKKEQEAKKDALKEELEGYKKIIDAKKEALQKEKDDKDYQTDLTEKQTEITKVENKILELQNDNSLSAKKKRQEYEEELIKLKKELNDMQEEHALDSALDALDKEYEAFEETQNNKIDAIDDYLDQEGKLRQDAIKRIENDQEKLYKELLEWNRKYGTAIDSDITNAWNKAMEGMEAYGEGQNGVLATIENIVAKLKEANEEIKQMNENSGVLSNEMLYDETFSNSPDSNSTVKPTGDAYQSLIDKVAPQMNRNSDAWANADEAERKRLASENEKLAKQIGAWKGSDGRWYVQSNEKIVALKDLYPTYHTGGIVGGEAEAGLKSTEQFAKLLKGEVVSTESQIRQFLNVTYPKMLGITQGNSPTGITIDRFVDITVQGNLDTSVDLENIIKRASQKAIDTLVNTMSNMGIRGRII